MGRPKKAKPFRYLVRDKSRHGTVRLYYREPKGKRYRIEVGEDHSDFTAHYAAARAGRPLPAPSAEPTPAKAAEPGEGTLAALVREYSRSAAFKELRPQGQRARLAILESCCAELMKSGKPFGTIPVERFEPRHAQRLLDLKAGLPGAANNRIKYLRILFGWASLPVNPAGKVKMLAPRRKDGHHAWTLGEVAQFERGHQVGSVARLAFDLALYTAARRADVAALGPENVEIDGDGNAWLSFVQGKTGGAVELPVVEPLALSIAAAPRVGAAFLTTKFGKPYTAAGLGNAFHDWCVEAGLPKGCAIHGLRKAAASKLAELGCTDEEIKAITGHATSKQVAVYTRSARRRLMAGSAMRKLQESLAAPPPMLEGPKGGDANGTPANVDRRNPEKGGSEEPQNTMPPVS